MELADKEKIPIYSIDEFIKFFDIPEEDINKSVLEMIE